MKRTSVLYALAGFAFVAGTASAQNLTITVQGEKQAVFKGEIAHHTGNKQAGDRTELKDVRYSMAAPFDIASGQTTGKTLYKPLVIVKRAGASSPQYLTALALNENLKSVSIEVFKPDARGQ